MLAEPGTRAELEDLYRREYDGMVRLATLLVGHTGQAEELVQDCFVRLSTLLSGGGAPDRPGAYLRTMVVNACRSAQRRARLEATRRPDPRPEAEPTAAEELRDALAQLNERQRAAIVLKYYADWSEADIAQALGCRPGTVKSLTHRALARLREVLPQ